MPVLPETIMGAAALGAGASFFGRRYLNGRLSGQEDRFMALYGRDDWDSCNMDTYYTFDPEKDAHVKRVFRERVQALIDRADPAASLFHETAEMTARGIELKIEENVRFDDLCTDKRRGLRFDLSRPGEIRAVWNHVQTDGVGLWDGLREAFDPSPPLVHFADARTPPPFVPEVLALPVAARRLAWRGSLTRDVTDETTKLVHSWPADEIRAAKDDWGANFNLVSAAALAGHVFERHPEKRRITMGILVFFPFVSGRNRYGVLQVRVARGSVREITRQLERQTRFPLLRWGASAIQTFALSQLPERVFEPVMRYYRKQIDVLISNLPVGTTPALIDGVPIRISCHPWELAAPYYLLLVGTRDQLVLSVSSRFEEADDFMATPGLEVSGVGV